MKLIERINSILPAPRFLRLPSVGVDISDTSLKYIQFEPDSRSGKRLELKKWGSIDILEGCLVRGEVKDSTKLVEALKEVRKQTGSEYIRVSLPEEKAYLFETEIKKGTPFKEIRGQLEFSLEENVPLSPRDSYFDYHIFDDEIEAGKMMVSVAAYSKDTINDYYEACLAADFVPIAFEVEAQAIARATLSPDNKGTYLIVDFGKTRTGIGIVHRGILMYTSTIDIGGQQMSTALRKQLGDLSEEELTEIKNNKGLVREIDDSSVYEALVSTVSAIKDEISIRIQYWNNKNLANKDRFIEEIVLCGGSSNLKGLPEYFTETLDIETKMAEVWKNAFAVDDFVPPIDLRHSYGYATAIGLGIAPFI